jgi:hypothetical protein
LKLGVLMKFVSRNLIIMQITDLLLCVILLYRLPACLNFAQRERGTPDSRIPNKQTSVYSCMKSAN